MKIDHDDTHSLPLEILYGAVCRPEWTIDALHETSSLQVDDTDLFAGLRFVDATTVTDRSGRIIQRPQDIWIGIQYRKYFLFIPDMITAGNDIDTGIEIIIDESGSEPLARCAVLAIGDDEIEILRFLEVRYRRSHHLVAFGSDYISNEKNVDVLRIHQIS